MKKEDWEKLFLEEIHEFIHKLETYNCKRNSINCSNCFNNLNAYEDEKLILKEISKKNYKNTKEQGNILVHCGVNSDRV